MNELQSLEQQLQTIFHANSGMEDMSWKDSMKGLLFDLSSFLRRSANAFRKPLAVAELGPAKGIEQRKNYMDVMSTYIVTPDGFQGNMNEFITELSNSLASLNKLAERDLVEFNKWLSKVISTGTLEVGSAPNLKGYAEQQAALKTFITDKPTSVTFGQAYSSLGALPTAVEDFNQVVRTVKTTAPSQFLRLIERADELSDILYKLMESGEVNLGDTTGNKFVAERLLDLARVSTFAGMVFALASQTAVSLTETSKRIAK